jgi:HEAT repeat protein/cyclophilin family peptidyl-prolyl cis-trans isomerase
MMRPPLLIAAASVVAAFAAACASAPVVVPVAAPELTFEQKMGWILRLEEDRVLQLPGPPAPAPPPPPAAGRGRGPVVAPPPPPPQPDLVALLKDREARVRRRAALAIGRTRVAAGAAPLAELLAAEPEPEVRQMAAFALGLLHDAAAAPALTTALNDSEPLVQGRAAEALGLIGHKPAADAIAAMMQTHLKAGALTDIAPDDLEHPKAAPVEAVRLGAYALVRLAAFDALAATLTDGGRPISRWWPVAYAFRRVGDARAGPILLALLNGPGTYTRAFAARGLGAVKETRAVQPLVAVLANDGEPVNVRIEAVRSLAELAAAPAVEPLIKIVTTPKVDANLRLEAITALGELRAPAAVELLVDLLTDQWPSIRAAALTGLARTDPDTFITAISGLDPDPHWSVRAALATALGGLGAERSQARLAVLLEDRDQRVIPAVIRALVAASAPQAATLLLERLEVDDAVVRSAAVNGLVRIKAMQATAALTRAYERAEKDPTNVVRIAILNALAELDRAAAGPLLQRALVDRDWAVRLRAATLLKTIDATADTSVIRPAPASPVAELNDLPALTSPSVSPVAYIDTEKGMIQIELAVLDAPRTVANFIALARRNFLGATPFHRVVANFVVQDGDPRGDGAGGPGYTIRDEINQRPYMRGTVGMALAGEDTGGSQFFITHGPQPHLDGLYTVFGHVVDGMDVVDRLVHGDQIRTVRVWDGVNWIGPK